MKMSRTSDRFLSVQTMRSPNSIILWDVVRTSRNTLHYTYIILAIIYNTIEFILNKILIALKIFVSTCTLQCIIQ